MRWNSRTFMAALVSYGRGEFAEQSQVRVRLFALRKVAALRHDVHARVRNQLLVFRRITRRDEPVALAPHDLQRELDPVQPLRQVRIVEARLPGETCERVQILLGRVLRVRSDGLREAALGDALIEVELARPLLGRPEEDIAFGEAGDVDA